jgi:SagB-type dehydrogenase family enzyme
MALEEAIARRGSCRRFAEGPLPLSLLSTLLRHAYGLGESYRMGEWAAFNRPVPSGGGCYPLELYLFVRQVDGVEAGTYHYCVRDHALELLGAVPSLNLVEELFLGQPWLARAQVVLVVSAVPARLLHRYGERGYRYLLLEAGHVGQNLSLLATATGSGSLCLGGFLDDALTTVLGLDPMLELPMYGVAVGMPESTSQLEARALDLF